MLASHDNINEIKSLLRFRQDDPQQLGFSMIFKTLIIFLVIALAEVLNGNLRVRFLIKRFGKKRAKFLSFVLGITFIYVFGLLFLPWIGPKSYQECFLIGLIWMLLMFLVDIYFAIKVFHKKWHVVIEDLNILKGNYLGLGMILLLFCPLIVFHFNHQFYLK